MRTIVLGPPGTGKTTTLLGKVDSYLKNTDPDKIGYFAFTQKAAHEARDRAMRDFNLGEDDLPYFRTLHSLAFRKLGLKKDQVMQSRHYKDLGSKLGFPVTYADYQEDQGGIFTSDSEYLRIIQLAQLRNITPEQQFDLAEHTQDLERDQLRIIANELKRYKKEYNLIDFNDMILDFTKSDKSPKFDVVFIDEAQDFHKNWFNPLNDIVSDDGQIFFFYDPLQTTIENSISKVLREPDKINFPVFNFNANYRNSSSISYFLSKLIDHNFKEFNLSYSKHSKVNEGKPPELIEANSFDEIIDQTIIKVKHLIANEKFKPKDIGILGVDSMLPSKYGSNKSMTKELTKIGLIQSANNKSSIVDYKGKEINPKNKGYFHKF